MDPNPTANQEEKPEDSGLNVVVSDDGMCAKLEAKAPGLFTDEDVWKALSDKGIIHGIDESAIESFFRQIKGGDGIVKAGVARGTPPTEATDGNVLWRVKVNRSSGHIATSGTIDYHESDTVYPVRKGQVLAVLVRPTNGTNGTNVYGKTVRPTNTHGKCPRLRAGKNVRMEPDNSLVAECDGVVTLASDSLRVSELLSIPGDVDYTVGNIHFPGVVTIAGSVKSGFMIEAEDDVHISGSVVDAVVCTHGNITVAHGVVGEGKSQVRAGGNIEIGFIENSYAEAGGNVDIRNHAINSVVYAEGHITALFGKGALMSHEFHARLGIDVKTAGSDSEEETFLVLNGGADSDRELDELREKLATCAKEIKRVRCSLGEKRLNEFVHHPEVLSAVKDDKRLKFKKLFLEYRRQERIFKTIIHDIHALRERARHELAGAIQIREKIHGGCHLRIGRFNRQERNEKTGPLAYRLDSSKEEIIEHLGELHHIGLDSLPDDEPCEETE